MGKSEENEKKCETFFTKNLNDEELNQKILEEFLKEAEEIERRKKFQNLWNVNLQKRAFKN